MYPVLLRIGDFALDTYSVVWLVALILAIGWTVRRFPLYGVDDGEARRVIFWSFLAMLLGAALLKPLWHIRFYAKDPALILTQGGLSEAGAVVGAFLTASFLCWRSPRISFQALCDVVSLPAMLTIAVGRWGCFLNGCCVGLESDFPLALRFPRDPAGVTRHPTQLYYSVIAAVILVALLTIERRLQRKYPERGRTHHAVIAPLTLILYTLMRFSIDFLRAETDTLPPLFHSPLSPTHLILLAGLPFECWWLWRSLKSLGVRNNSD